MVKKAASRPTPEETLALYDAARRFRDGQIWETLSEGDLFGVRDPESGTTGYCSVMGQLGEYFAMHVYLGGEGLAGYRAMHNAWDDEAGEPSALDLNRAARSQKSLTVEYQNAAEVSRDEKALIKRLGLAFRGRHAWPSFQRNDPGMAPGRLDARETRFLTAALEQAMAMAERVRRDDTVLTGPLADDHVRVRVPTTVTGTTVWSDVIEPFEPAPEFACTPLPEDVRRALAALPVRNTRVELAHTFLAAFIQGGKDQRASVPRLLLLVDASQGLVLGFHLFADGEFPDGTLTRIATMLLNLGALPQQLALSDPWLHRQLFQALPFLRQSLMLVRHLDAAEEAYESMSEFMNR